MIAIKAARKFIETHPDNAEAKVLAHLVLALESDSAFSLAKLDQLGHNRFELAVDILREWRANRYYAGKAKLLDISWQLCELGASQQA